MRLMQLSKLAYSCLMALLMVGTTSLHSAARNTNVGTLTCTVAPGTQESRLETRELSCVFEPIAGIKGNFTGTIDRLGDTAPTADQLVLVWLVFAQEPTVEMLELEGRYIGLISNGSGELVSGDIALRPMSPLPNGTPNFAPLVLELDLRRLRA